MTTGSAGKIKADKGEQAPFTRMKQSKSVSHDKLMAIVDIGQKYFAQQVEKLDAILQMEVDLRANQQGRELIANLKAATFMSGAARAQLELVKKLALASAGSVTGKNTEEGKDLANALVNAAKEKLRAKFADTSPHAELLKDGIAPHANHG